MDRTGELLAQGHTTVCTVEDAKYSMVVFKNAKVGHKPPGVVPMLTNVHFTIRGVIHPCSGNEAQLVVAI